MQAGHALSGRTNSILFCEEAIRIQCQRCNVWLGGNYAIFHIRLQKEVGYGILERLVRIKATNKQFKSWELEEKIEDFKGKIMELERGSRKVSRNAKKKRGTIPSF